MTVILQTNNDENNKLSKSPFTIAEKEGSQREATSIVQPKIRIQGSIGDYKNCNYLTIPSFGRKYFVTDIISVGNGVVELTCRCDVLSSFASEIRSNTAVIARQENVYNKYLNDPAFKVYQNKRVTTHYLSGSGFTTAGYVLITSGQAT